MHCADAVQCFGQEAGNARSRSPAVHLRTKHSLLNRSRENVQRWYKRNNHPCETGRFYKNDRQYADNLTDICCHANDAAGKQFFHGIDITYKP